MGNALSMVSVGVEGLTLHTPHTKHSHSHSLSLLLACRVFAGAREKRSVVLVGSLPIGGQSQELCPLFSSSNSCADTESWVRTRPGPGSGTGRVLSGSVFAL
eukprot:293619-Rhodomonas_salina.1